MAEFVQAGDILDYTVAGTAVAAGDVINLGSGLCGIAVCDGAVGDTIGVQVEGVVKAPKAAGTGVTFAVGAQVDWDTSGETCVATGGDFRLGVCVKAAVTGDSSVLVKLNRNKADAAASV